MNELILLHSIKHNMKRQEIALFLYNIVYNSEYYILLRGVQTGVGSQRFTDPMTHTSLCINEKLKNTNL